MGVVVGVVGVHLLLLQAFSHVAAIQSKLLEAGERSSQAGTVRSQRLAWILKMTVSNRGGWSENVLLLLGDV